MNALTPRLPLLAALLLLSGCKLLKPSPEKACARAEELFGDTSTDLAGDHARCVADLTRLKREDPKAYACTTRCLQDGPSADEAKPCMAECRSGSTANTKGAASDVASSEPVDELTPSSLKSKVAAEYRYLGYDIASEKENAAGWSATVALGKKASLGEVHIYKVLLVDVKNKTDGYKLVSSMRKSGVADESRVGNKKALFVQCLYQRSSNQTGTPRDCGAYDAKIGSFTDDLAKL